MVGPALCQRVRQQLESMGVTLVPPAAGEGQAAPEQGAPPEQQQQGEQQQSGEQQPPQQAGQKKRKQQHASAEELEGDFAGVALLPVSCGARR